MLTTGVQSSYPTLLLLATRVTGTPNKVDKDESSRKKPPTLGIAKNR